MKYLFFLFYLLNFSFILVQENEKELLLSKTKEYSQWEKLHKEGINNLKDFNTELALKKFQEAYKFSKKSIKNTEYSSYSLSFIARIYRDEGPFLDKPTSPTKIIEIHKELLNLYKKTYTKNSINYSNALTYMAEGYESSMAMENSSKYDKKVISLYNEALQIREKIVGKDLGYSRILKIISNSYYFDDINNSFIYMKKYLSVLRSVLGEYHPLYVEELELAKEEFEGKYFTIDLNKTPYTFYDNSKNFLKKEYTTEAFEANLDVYDAALYFCTSEVLDQHMNNLQEEYSEDSKYIGGYDFETYTLFHKKWLATYLYNRKIIDFIYSKEHIYYIYALKNICFVYNKLNDNEKVLTYLNECESILKKNKKHPEIYLKTLNNLVYTNELQGNYFKSIDLYNKIIPLNESAYSKNSDEYRSSIIHLSSLLIDIGDYDKSISELKNNTFFFNDNIKSKEYYIYYNSFLGLAYSKKSDFKASIKYLNKSIEKLNEKIPENIDNHHVSNVLMYMGDCYFGLNEYTNAIKYYKRSLQSLDKLHGNAEFNINLTYGLAKSNFYLKNYSETLRLLKKNVDQIKNTLSIKHPKYLRATKLLTQYYLEQNNIEELIIKSKEISKNINNQLFKSFSLSSEGQKKIFLKNIIGDSYELIQSYNYLTKNKYNDLTVLSVNNSLSHKGLLLNSSKDILPKLSSLKNPKIDSLINKLIAKRKLISKLNQNDINTRKLENDSLYLLEVNLAKTYSTYFKTNIEVKKNWQKTKLKDNELAIEFTHYRVYYKKWTDSTMYAAYLYKKDWKTPKVVNLFEEKQLKKYFTTTSNPNKLYASRGIITKSNKAKLAVADSIYKLVWKPLEKYVNNSSKIYFSPDGLLHKIPFATLPNADNKLIGELYDINQMGNTADVRTNNTQPNLEDILLIGGVNYEYKEDSNKPKKEYTYNVLESKALLGNEKNRSISKNGFEYLPGTKKEITDINFIFNNANQLSGYNATETAFKKLSGNSPSILHIATHGFFFPKPKEKRNPNQLITQENNYSYAEDPLLRSGLLFANANYAWQNGNNPYEEDDGILTALEISNLDLKNTDIVILSACETGLGDIEGSEGVYGLQRAFKMAGVKTIIMSLWEVPDAETAEFMNLFYTNWKALNNPKKAFKKTQSIMMKKYRDTPEKWAAFVYFE